MNTKNFFQTQLFWWGIYYGIVSVVSFLLIYLLQPAWIVSTIYWISGSVLLPLIFMILGGLAERKQREAGMTYGQAYVAVLLIGITGLLLNSIINPVLTNLMPEMQETIVDLSKQKMIDRLEESGMDDDQIEVFSERFDGQAQNKNKISAAVLAFVIGGVVLSLLALIAALPVRNVRESDIMKA